VTKLIALALLLVGCATDPAPTVPKCADLIPSDAVKPYPLTCNDGGLCIYEEAVECCVPVGGVDRSHPDTIPDPKCEGVFNGQ
jgi:hypothetical protein